MEFILPILSKSILITGFVFVIMLVIEYVNVQTRGMWQHTFLRNKWKQYLFAALLGAIPGCLGSFTAVALFSHRLMSFGALVTTMIATSGDEAFIMLAMMPKQAILLTIIIVVIGIIAGFLTDKYYKPTKILKELAHQKLTLHEQETCKCFQKETFLQALRKPSRIRIILVSSIFIILVLVISGILAHHAKIWVQTMLIISVSAALFIVITVPEHFLKEHLWNHIVKVHLPKIFLWTLGALIVLSTLMNFWDIKSLVSENMLIVLLVAVLIGIIPESGPHLLFVTLFAEGILPFSVLIASSIVQDGHGMLPLLAESKRGFITVKAINILFALAVGALGYFAEF